MLLAVSTFRFKPEQVVMLFKDRSEAGRVLARRLERFRDHPNVIVLALPHGGVPVAYEVARKLNLPLDVFSRSTTHVKATRFASTCSIRTN